MKKKIKNSLIELQLDLMSHGPVKTELMDIARQANSAIPTLCNDEAPYGLKKGYAESDSFRHDIVMTTSRFRSGSTLLWNVFRQAGGFTAYYEPLNERRWFDETARGSRVDSTHRGVDDYWSEYTGLHELGDLYNEDWIRRELLMGERSFDPRMKAYVECLVRRAPQRPILQFNRVDFRLAWLKANFPNAKLLHLYRHPRDQWCSFLIDKKLMNKDAVAKTYVDGFYLDVWCDDLAIHFPFLDKRKTPHPYSRFYYVWKLSYLFGKRFADYSFSFEDLVIHPEIILGEMFAVLNVNNPPIDRLCGLIDAPPLDGWRGYAEPEWFEKFEQECEHQLDLFFASSSCDERRL